MLMRFRKKCEGYTFIELLLAVTILALITAPLLGLLATGFTAIHLAGQQTAAVNLCRAAMESVKSAGYDTAYHRFIVEGLSPELEENLPEAPHFRRVTEVTPLSPGDGGALQGLGLLHIRITVYWTVKGVARSAALESYLAPR
jgi:prepilin-type N-terminal cleavage/methylation domain-containing protein